jgi:hypothetical protein
MLKDLNLVIAHVDPGAIFSCNESGEIVAWSSERWPAPTAETLMQWEKSWKASLVQPKWEEFLLALYRSDFYADLIPFIGQAGFEIQVRFNNLTTFLSSERRTPVAMISRVKQLLYWLAQENLHLPAQDITEWNQLMISYDFPEACQLPVPIH